MQKHKATDARKAKVLFADKQITAIVERLLENKPVRRALSDGGMLHIDRQLPFLCLYRQKAGTENSPITGRLLYAEAAYALVPGEREYHPSLLKLLHQISRIMVERFGSFLFLEIWSSGEAGVLPKGSPPRAAFTVHAFPSDEFSAAVQTLREGLAAIKTSTLSASVDVAVSGRIGPPGKKPLFSSKELEKMGCSLIGIDVSPIFTNPKTDEPFPLLFRSVKRQLARVLDKTFYSFSVEHTTHQPSHYYALGRRAMVKAVWDVDRRLAAVSNSFDLLLQITPVNAERAWRTFRRRHFEKAPTFLYRPRVIDPAVMKRALYDVPIERVEDPTLMHLFLDKQMELDRQLTMLHDLGTKRFLYESLQLHGTVSGGLKRVAQKILENTSAYSARAESRGGMLSASEFAKLARAEVAWYASRSAEFDATVQISDDMYSGLMVSRGRLLIGKDTRIPKERAQALIQHEIGTHLLTYYNGRAQPFKMLSSGLPGYDELQEGMAVLSEYLVGGLSTSRLRILAARVMSASALIDGASFVDVFRLLDRTYAFSQRVAYTVTMRVFRGGGLLKDAVYLRGLVEILKYLTRNGDYNSLFVGKIAISHTPVIEELLLRKILMPPPCFPSYMEHEDALRRMARLRKGTTVLELLDND